MSNYVDLVLVQFSEGRRPHLFKAPGFSTKLTPGTSVEVMTRLGVESGEVVAKSSVVEDSETYRFAVLASGAKEPLGPVLTIVTRETIGYPMNIDTAPTSPSGE